MKVVIIGSGNVASQISYNLFRSDNPVYQVYSRSDVGEQLKNNVLEIVRDFDQIDSNADLYLLCVSDDAISSVATSLSYLNVSRKAVIAHTSGTKSSELLTQFSHYGVLYPLQTLRKETLVDFTSVPLLINGSSKEALSLLRKLADVLSKNVHQSSDEQRAKYHIPAVMVNNLVNHIYHQAYQYCNVSDLDFKLLLPLLAKTSERIVNGDIPFNVQTGPAIREDMTTIFAHLATLKELNMNDEIYASITESIIETYHNQSMKKP